MIRSFAIINLILIVIIITLFCFSFIGCQQETPYTVCIFFDDGYENNYTVALPILLKYNFKATFGIITDTLISEEANEGHMNIEQLRELDNLGMDIASHTKTHADLTAILDDEKALREEIAGSKIYLEQFGFNVRTFVYPYTRWDEKLVPFVMDAGYICARMGWAHDQVWHPWYRVKETKYLIPSFEISDITFDNFKSIVRRAKNRSVVCLMYHSVKESNITEYSILSSDFEKQMNYLKEKNFTVETAPDIVEFVKDYRSKYGIPVYVIE